jgi:acyl-CoA thioesterase II
MGDLANDTAIRPRGDGCYEASLSADWEIWGPMGGYVAACALRAAGASTEQARPAAFSRHYLGVARFGPVDLRVETRRARTATSQRVEVSQGRPILDAMVWSVGDIEGLEHDETSPPDVPDPDQLPDIRELLPNVAEPPFPFWHNLEAKPIEFEGEWPPPGPRPARWQEWLRFTPTATFEDFGRRRPLRDPRRPAELAVGPPPARVEAATVHGADPDLNVGFHRPTSGRDWLLCDGAAPLSTAGLFGPRGCGPPAASSTRRSAGNACTAACLRHRPDSG